MIEKKFADLFANGAQVSLEVAEREVLLTYALKILEESGLIQKLAFKGGTCLRKCLYGKAARFSLDLDFTEIGRVKPEHLIGSLLKILKQPSYGIKFNLAKKDFYIAKDQSSCGAVIRYQHEWHEGLFKLEISLRETPSLPVHPIELKKQGYFKYLEFPAFSVPCLQFEELLAEKIRAAFQRIRSRDLHDLLHAAGKPFDTDLVRALVVIKCWNVRDSFDPQNFFNRIQSEKYDWDDLKQLVRRKENLNPKKLLATCLKRYGFLSELTEDEKTLVGDARRHKRKELPLVMIKRLNRNKV